MEKSIAGEIQVRNSLLSVPALDCLVLNQYLQLLFRHKTGRSRSNNSLASKYLQESREFGWLEYIQNSVTIYEISEKPAYSLEECGDLFSHNDAFER